MIGDPFSSEYWKSHFCRDSGHHISLLANLLRKEDKKKYKSAFQASYFIINEKERRRASRLYPTGGWRISRLLSVYCPKNVFPCGTSETRKKRLAAFRDKEKIEIAAFFKFINESVSGKDIKYYGDWRLGIWNEFSKELEAK